MRKVKIYEPECRADGAPRTRSVERRSIPFLMQFLPNERSECQRARDASLCALPPRFYFPACAVQHTRRRGQQMGRTGRGGRSGWQAENVGGNQGSDQRGKLP